MKTISLHPRRNRAGFTLIELLVVIAIIAILASLLLPVVSKVQQTALKNKAKLQARDIATAIEGYDSAYGRFPVSTNAQNQASLNYQAGLNPDFTYGGNFQKQDGTFAQFGTTVPVALASTQVLTNAEVIAILMDVTAFPNGNATVNFNHVKNPQQTRFLNATMSGDTSSPGVGTDLVYRDPWGNPYFITMDLNYDEECEDVFYSSQTISQNPSLPAPYSQSGFNGLVNPNSSVINQAQKDSYLFHGKVMVWSAGPQQLNNQAVVDPTAAANAGYNKNHILSWQ